MSFPMALGQVGLQRRGHEDLTQINLSTLWFG
jgi:hypothetical protein